jgi:predicted Na+-dependent transporter
LENFMLIKIAIILALLMIVFSLFSALFYLGKDKGSSERTARALTVRITLSILLFVLLITGYYFGLIGSNAHP